MYTFSQLLFCLFFVAAILRILLRLHSWTTGAVYWRSYSIPSFMIVWLSSIYFGLVGFFSTANYQSIQILPREKYETMYLESSWKRWCMSCMDNRNVVKECPYKRMNIFSGKRHGGQGVGSKSWSYRAGNTKLGSVDGESQSTYICVCGVFQNIDPHPPLPLATVSPPRTKGGGVGGDKHSPGGEGVGGQHFGRRQTLDWPLTE